MSEVFGIPALAYLSAVLFLPLAGAIIALLAREAAKLVAIMVTVLELALAIGLLIATLTANGKPAMTIAASTPWLPSFGLSYALQSDPLSIWLIVLTAFLLLIAVVAPVYTSANNGSPLQIGMTGANNGSPLQIG